MKIDGLLIIESLERAVETAESGLRRHALKILAAVAIGAAAATWLWWPHGTVATERPQARPSAAVARQASRNRGASPGAPRVAARLKKPPVEIIWVHVAGAVVRPGVVRLHAGTRAFHAVAAAGGVRNDADLTRVNLARRLKDEGCVVIPRVEDRAGAAVVDDAPLPTPNASEDGPPQANDDEAGANSTPVAREDDLEGTTVTAGEADAPNAGDAPARVRKLSIAALTARPVHLNKADERQLQAIPGIGPGLARAIVEWRRRHGAFARTEDVCNVPRFGERLWTRVRRCLVL